MMPMAETSEERTAKFALAFEAVKRCLLSCEVLRQRLWSEVKSVQHIVEAGGAVDELIAPALLSATAFVDFAYRFRHLVEVMPLVRQRAPEVLALIQATASVETARHHLQHMRRDLRATEPVLYPLLGAVSWVDGNRSFTVCLSSNAATDVASMSYDMVHGRFTADLAFDIKNTTVYFDAVLAQMRTVYAWLAVHSAAAELPKELVWGKTHAVRFSIVRMNNPPTDIDA